MLGMRGVTACSSDAASGDRSMPTGDRGKGVRRLPMWYHPMPLLRRRIRTAVPEVEKKADAAGALSATSGVIVSYGPLLSGSVAVIVTTGFLVVKLVGVVAAKMGDLIASRPLVATVACARS